MGRGNDRAIYLSTQQTASAGRAELAGVLQVSGIDEARSQHLDLVERGGRGELCEHVP